MPISDLYNLGDAAQLTVNEYGAVVLNSRNLAIADIDVSGATEAAALAKYPECNPLFESLIALNQLDTIAGTNLATQAYRIYRTHSGFRVICASLPMDRRDAHGKALADSWLHFLQADPLYIYLCKERENFRARLTPKPTRVEGQDGFTHPFDLMNGLCVAFLEQHGPPSSLIASAVSAVPGIHRDLIEQIRLHDEMCLPLTEGDRVA